MGDRAMKMISDPNYLNMAGLLFDIVGAVILAKSIFFNSVAAIAGQATTTWRDNPSLRFALCEQRVDAWFGLPLLVVGFLIQFASDFISLEIGPSALIALSSPLFVLGYFFSRRRLIAYSMSKSEPPKRPELR